MITETPIQARPARETPLAASLLWTIALGFCVFIFYFAVDAPYLDDYLLLFSITKMVAPADGVAFSELFTQHNEHRIFLARLVALLDYGIEGHVNFKTLALTGSLSVLALFYLLFQLYRRAKISPWALTPIALLLFQPSYYNNLLWSLSVWQHSITLAGYILLFWLAMHPARRMQLTALALGALLMYSNSNGTFAWATVMLLLACYGRRQEATVWLVTGLCLVSLYYLIDYEFYKKQSVEITLQHPVWIIRSLVGFLGGALFLDGIPWFRGISSGTLVWLLGLLTLSIFAFAWWEFLFRRRRDYPAVYPVLLGLSAVLFLTGLGASLTRSTGNLLILERYQIYSILCLITAYSLLLIELEDHSNHWLTIVATLVTALFAVNSYLYYLPELVNRQKRLLTEATEVRRHHHALFFGVFLSDPYWNSLLRQSIRLGVYRAPARTDRPLHLLQTARVQENSPVRFSVSERIDRGVNKKVIDLKHPSLPAPDYLLLRSGGEIHLLPAEREGERSRFRMLQNRTLFRSGVETSFYPEPLAPGRYQIGLLREVDGQSRIEWTRQYITR